MSSTTGRSVIRLTTLILTWNPLGAAAARTLADSPHLRRDLYVKM